MAVEMLSLKGTIVTANALNCQRAMAAQVVAQGGDYVLALKGNQGTLHDDVRLCLDDPSTQPTDIASTVDGDHGRIETRCATLSTDIGWLQEDHAWPGLAASGKVVRSHETATTTTTETAYDLLSTVLSPSRFAEVVRPQWGIESQLHWRLMSLLGFGRQLADLAVTLPGRRDGITDHALQCGGVVRQGGQVDLHGRMPNNTAASRPAHFRLR